VPESEDVQVGVPIAQHRGCCSVNDAAKESNLPSRGLPGPASFEERSRFRRSLDLQEFS
jgi:hypothetical protein